MFLETKRLIIRRIQTSDEKAFIEMASDGSLKAIYGDCSECDQTANVQNIASCKTLERAGFSVVETKLYQDLYDEREEVSNIYELIKN